MAKKEFAWDSEKLLGTIEISESYKKEVKLCTMKEKSFVVITDIKFYKGAWNPVKNFTCPRDRWEEVVKLAAGATVKQESKPAETGLTTIEALHFPGRVEALDLPSHICGALKRAGLTSVEDIMRYGDNLDTLLNIKGVSKKGLEVIKTALIKAGAI
jgi:DNA-directed RNA polymerase alpha subunit